MKRKQSIILLSIGIIVLLGGCSQSQETATNHSTSNIVQDTTKDTSETSSSKKESEVSTKNEANLTKLSSEELLTKFHDKESYFVVCSESGSEAEKYYQELLPTLTDEVARKIYFSDATEIKDSAFYQELQLNTDEVEYDKGILIYIENGVPKEIYYHTDKTQEQMREKIESL